MLNIRFHRSSAPITDAELVSVINGIRPAIADENHPDRDYALLLAKLVLRIDELKRQARQVTGKAAAWKLVTIAPDGARPLTMLFDNKVDAEYAHSLFGGSTLTALGDLPNHIDFCNGDAAIWIEDGKVKAEWNFTGQQSPVVSREQIAQAKEALDNLDDYARMDVGVDAMGPRGVLEKFIASVEHERFFASMREEATRRERDQAVTPAYAAWLDEQAKQGIEAHGGNEIWNAATKAAFASNPAVHGGAQKPENPPETRMNIELRAVPTQAQKPFAYFQWNSGWKYWEEVSPSAASSKGVVAAYSTLSPSVIAAIQGEQKVIADSLEQQNNGAKQ